MKSIPYELILLFNKNYKPKELIAIGYKRATVYRTYHKFHEVFRRFEQAKKRLNDLRLEGRLK